MFALFTLSTAILGYSGLFRRLTRDPHEDLKLESYRIIDYAQLWYSKPKAAGGGGRSFLEMDFRKIGVSDTVGVTLSAESGTFEFRNVRPFQFDLVAVSNDGTVFRAADLGYDTRPELLEIDP